MSDRHWKSGPKPKPAEEIRSKRVTIRMTPSEYAAATKGKPDGLSSSAWFYHLVSSRKVPQAIPAVNREAWANLGRVAGGLTTLAQGIGRGLLQDATDEHLHTLQELRREVAELRRLLLTGEVDES